MFSYDDNISIHYEIQGFFQEKSQDDGISVTDYLTSKQITKEIECPCCGGAVAIHERATTTLRDLPLFPNMNRFLKISYHRYRCLTCKKEFAEKIPCKYPGTRLTERAAFFVKTLLDHGMTIRSVQEITGIHWDTIRKLHEEDMQIALDIHESRMRKKEYKPQFLAVDEFAIHKGHNYATCVLDLIQGDVIWVGKGRTISDFTQFFKEVNIDYLSDVKAIAMDMNASYNRLVSEYMPWAKIVYDRYHVQAQFGKDVLGAVRLAEANKHKANAHEIKASIHADMKNEEKKELKQKEKAERKLYSTLKGARWEILKNARALTPEDSDHLQRILDEHSDLAICYAMKEEMNAIFNLFDEKEAEERWCHWFCAAKASNIPALVKFATQKEKRLPGLISHAEYPINTGKLEGLNNKIKVAKRLAYGYRNDNYFFTLIRYMTIPIP